MLADPKVTFAEESSSLSSCARRAALPTGCNERRAAFRAWLLGRFYPFNP